MKTLIKHILFLFLLFSMSFAFGQNSDDILTFFDGDDVHLRWKGIPDANLTGYRIYRDNNGKWKKVSDNNRLVKNSKIKDIVGGQAELYLKLAGAQTATSDFTNDLYARLIANDEAYQFFGAMTVLDVNMAQAMGEYYKLKTKSLTGETVRIKITALYGSDERDYGEVVVSIRGKEKIEIPHDLVGIPHAESVELVWNKDEGASEQIVGFYVYRSKSLLGPFNKMNSIGMVFSTFGQEQSVNGYVDDYMDIGTYYYYVTNYNVFGLESDGSEIIKVVLSDDDDLQPVTNFTASETVGIPQLDWDSTPTVQNFTIYRSTKYTTDFEVVYPPSSRILFNDFHYLDRTAEQGVLYYYYVETANGTQSISSDTISFMLNDKTPPSAPTEIKGSVSKTGVVSLSWKANDESDLLGYEVERYTGDSGTNNFLLTPKPITTSQFTEGLGDRSQSAYRYVIYAIDQSYNRSIGSIPIRLRRPDDIAPRVPTITYVMLTDSILQLRWTPNLEDDFDQYTVYRNEGSGNQIKYKTTSTNSLLDTLSTENEYRYAITALDRDGNESKQSEDHAIAFQPEFSLSPPGNGQAIDSNGSIFLRWDVSTDPRTIGYLIERQEAGSAVVQLVKEHKTKDPVYLDRHAKSSKKYTYYITAYDTKWFVSKALKVEFKGE